MLSGLLKLLKSHVLSTGCPPDRESSSRLGYLPSKLDTHCCLHIFRTSSPVTIRPGSSGPLQFISFSNHQLTPTLHHEPSPFPFHLFGTCSNLTSALLTLLHLSTPNTLFLSAYGISPQHGSEPCNASDSIYIIDASS